MKAIAELLNALLKLINRALARQEQKQHEATVDEIQDNPGAFMSGHFGSVPDKSIDHNADQAATKRNSAD